MDESTTITCRICCLRKIKQEVKTNDDLVLSSKLVSPNEDVVQITENPVACNNCKVEIDEMSSFVHPYLIKEEIKEEFVEDLIKSENIVEDHSVSFNTDIPLCIEESISVNILHCYKCNYSTSKANTLGQHIRRKHAEGKPKQKSIDRADTHTRKKLFKCKICNHQTKYSRTFATHLRKHSGERPFWCDECEYKTYSKHILNYHKKVHSDEEPFKCSLCDFSSKYSRNLKLHSQKHSRELNFNCDMHKTSKIIKTFIPKKPLNALCDFSSKYSRNLKYIRRNIRENLILTRQMQ
ncbi:hypothetical protein FQR65_LT07296 [Abscondita terminalis]|nr:hypothetical protein FQR65_LT07296 [Abscondita terminalis]